MERTNKQLQEWLEQFKGESKIVIKGDELILITPNGDEWIATNDILQ